MTPDDFHNLQGLVSEQAGFRLSPDRMNLAEHRLGPVARREGFHNVEALLATLWNKPLSPLSWSVIEALLNGETWFNRDQDVFEVYRQELIPALATARPGRKLRIWSAGTSTGQEAYSLAMHALDHKVPVDILATDLSHHAIRRASGGLYTSFEIQRGLSARTMLRWFEQSDEHWCARTELRQVIRFERANLLEEPPQGSKFDVIFCRYLLQDMEPHHRLRLLDQLEKRLVDDGCLFLGADEKPDALCKAFRPVVGRRGIFVKSPEALRRAA